MMKENIKFNKDNLELRILEKINEHDRYNEKILFFIKILYIIFTISMTGTICFLVLAEPEPVFVLSTVFVAFVLSVVFVAFLNLFIFGVGMVNMIKAMSSETLLGYFVKCYTDKEFRDFFMAIFNSRKIIKYNDRNEIDSFFIKTMDEENELHKIDIIKKSLL
ncbi:hypothetical protein [Xenorhabdus bovienii]|uniref:hypothetical protein n=1 Tax=Xenorhabdus bovienii TaxID=40576 RepID=UPI0021589B1D|nr:hypothetical protein [Xenorhabdus bovienii]